MDKTELQQKIAEFFNKLPKDAQDIFSSMTWVDAVSDICDKYKLSDTQKESVTIETSLALLGVIHLNEYEESLIKETGIPVENIKTMISEIDKQVFESIRPALETAFTNNAKSASEENSNTLKPIDARFNNLPKDTQDAIQKSDYQKNLYVIANKYKLSMSDMGALDEVTTQVMLGKLLGENYKAELSKNITTSPENLENITREVNELVFGNIRSFLMQKTKQETSINTIIEENDDVPIPPYKKVDMAIPPNLPIMKADIPPNNTGDTMMNSGVEIMSDVVNNEKEEEKVTVKEDSIMVKSGVSMIENIAPQQKDDHLLPNSTTQKSILNEIENPKSTPIKNIMEMKLGGTTVQNTSSSNHTIAKDPTSTPPASSQGVIHDPYHEQI